VRVSTAGDVTASINGPTTGREIVKPKRGVLRTGVIAIAIVAVLVAGTFVFTDGFHVSRGSSAAVLLPAKSFYSIPGGQYNAIAFHAESTAVINGTFTNTKGITLYTMTPAQLLSLSKTGLVDGYSWTSGRIANLTVTDLNLEVQAGQWDLLFLNADGPSPIPNPSLNTTVIGFYTDLAVIPS
jgi:hypothetical protein